MDKVNFTTDDALVLLSSLLGNRPMRVLENNPISVNKDDVVLYKDSTGKLYLYNVLENGTVNNNDSDLLQLIDLKYMEYGGIDNIDVPAWHNITTNAYSQIYHVDFWKRLMIIGPDFVYYKSIDEMIEEDILSRNNPRHHVTIYIKPGAKSHFIYAFNNLINMDGAPNCTIFISRI